MTIREHFKRTFQRVKWAAVVFTTAAVAFLLWRYPKLTTTEDSLLLGVPMAVVLLFVFHYMYKCPRCGTNLGKLGQEEWRVRRRVEGWRAWLNPDTRQIWELWDKCPQCGVSFDAPYEPLSG